MTQFEHLELIYNQFFNLTIEINALIEEEEYEIAASKLEHKEKLLAKLLLTKKTVDFTSEEIEKAQSIEQKIKENEQKHIAKLEELQSEVKESIKNVKNKVKVNVAYDGFVQSNSGLFLDVSE